MNNSYIANLNIYWHSYYYNSLFLCSAVEEEISSLGRFDKIEEERSSLGRFDKSKLPEKMISLLPDLLRQIEPTSTFDVLKPPLFLEKFKEAEEISEAIAIVRFAGFESVANRLGEIYLAEIRENYERPLSLESLKEFIQFLLENARLKEPYLAASPEGNIVAIWQKSDEQLFWIEFYPNGDVQYLAFMPNDKRSDGIERTSGISTRSDVYNRAESLGIISWIKNGSKTYS